MNPYRLKHIDTGLYFKPGCGGTLDKKGKIYTTGASYLSYIQDIKDNIYIYPWTRVYKDYPELFEKYQHVYYSCKDKDGNRMLDYIVIPVTRESFIKEELEINIKI